MILTNAYIAGFVSLRGWVKGDPPQEYILQVSGTNALPIMTELGRRYGLTVQEVEYKPKIKWAKKTKAYRLTWHRVKLQRLIADCFVYWTEDEQMRFGGELGSRAPGGSVVALLDWMGPNEVSTKEVADYLQVTRSSAHKKLHRLMEDGLIDREVGPREQNVWVRV